VEDKVEVDGVTDKVQESDADRPVILAVPSKGEEELESGDEEFFDTVEWDDEEGETGVVGTGVGGRNEGVAYR